MSFHAGHWNLSVLTKPTHDEHHLTCLCPCHTADSALVVGGLASQDLPWSFKVFYGLLSDTVPIRGKRRKPYYLIGWAMFLLANAALAMLGEPSIGAIMLLVSAEAHTCVQVLDKVVSSRCARDANLFTPMFVATMYRLSWRWWGI